MPFANIVPSPISCSAIGSQSDQIAGQKKIIFSEIISILSSLNNTILNSGVNGTPGVQNEVSRKVAG